MTDINKTPDDDDSAAQVAAVGGFIVFLLAVLIYSAPWLIHWLRGWLMG